MNVLMISTDRTLLRPNGFGDAINRHRQYASRVERLDILVLAKKRTQRNQLAENCLVEPVYFWRAKPMINAVCRRHPYDLVVCQDPFLTATFGRHVKERLKEAKLIIHFHGDFFDNPYWLKEQWRNRWYRRLAENNITQADSIRAVSGAIKQKLVNRGIEAHNIYVIPTPVNLEAFVVEPAPRTKPIVLTVGRMVKAKDFPTLIAAAARVASQVPNLEWLIAGDGPLRQTLMEKTKDQPYLRWLGNVNHDQLKTYYQQANAVVMTSSNESFGKVFLEAAMARVPAVATDTAGAREIIIDGESGYIVPIGDAVRCAERVTYLLQQPQLAATMGRRAYEIVSQKFGWQKSIDAIIAMWQQTAKTGG